MSENMGVLDAKRPEFDEVLTKIAEYAVNFKISSNLAYETARYCLMDTIGCGLLALDFPACTKLLGPVVEGAEFRPLGAKIPGTSWARWLDG